LLHNGRHILGASKNANDLYGFLNFRWNIAEAIIAFFAENFICERVYR
jgi:hypothetical protein